MQSSSVTNSNLGTISQAAFDRLNAADYPGAKVFVIGSAGALTEYSSLGTAWKQVAPFTDTHVTQIQASVSGGVGAWRGGSRPVLLSWGESVNRQDYPDLTTSTLQTFAWNSVSPMQWANALCCGAFDYLGPFTTPCASTYAGWTTAQDHTNGVWGYSGSPIQVLAGAVDNLIAQALPLVGTRQAYVMIQGNINTFALGDTADTAWTFVQQICEKIVALGWVPLIKCGEVSASHDTPAKVKEALRYRDIVLRGAAAIGAIPVDIFAARQTYARALTLDKITRSGDKIHPNQTGAVIHGYAYADALDGKILKSPPWMMDNFTGTLVQPNPYLSGTSGSLNVSGTTPTGNAPANTDLNSSGTNCPLVGAQAARDSVTGFLLDCTGSASNTTADIGLATLNTPNLSTATVYRAWVDFDVIQADYVRNLSVRVRFDAGTYFDMATPFTADQIAMTADQPNAIKLLEGRRLVFSSMPAQFSALVNGTSGQMRRVGGSQGLEASQPLARLRTYTRFASLIAG